MIKTNELRIGNFVMVENKLLPNYKNQPIVVTSIQQRSDKDFPNSKHVISCEVDKYNGISQFDEFVVPIELNVEWLQKFSKSMDVGYWISVTNLKSELHFEIYRNEIVTILKGQFCNLILDNIKYVHQLQNLYFALTGCELQYVH